MVKCRNTIKTVILFLLWKPRVFRLENIVSRSFSLCLNTLKTGSFKMFKLPLPGFLKILTL